jgi:hypothetical protein
VKRRTVERIALGLAVVFALYVAAALWPRDLRAGRTVNR